MEIKRKDGINYFRKDRKVKYDTRICLRISSEKYEKFQKMAKIQGKKTPELLREIFDNYLIDNTLLESLIDKE